MNQALKYAVSVFQTGLSHCHVPCLHFILKQRCNSERCQAGESREEDPAVMGRRRLVFHAALANRDETTSMCSHVLGYPDLATAPEAHTTAAVTCAPQQSARCPGSRIPRLRGNKDYSASSQPSKFCAWGSIWCSTAWDTCTPP